jgi:tetratricopeptide (TPR) repeat protein
MADRFTYLPLIGLYLIVAWAAPDLLVRWPQRNRALRIAAGVVLFELSLLSWLHAQNWRNSIVLFEHALEVTSNNALAHNNLGVALAEKGLVEEAIHHYELALRLHPTYADAHANLGVELASLGKFDEAIRCFEQALASRPEFAGAHHQLARALAAKGRTGEAKSHLREALRIRPNYEAARKLLEKLGGTE